MSDDDWLECAVDPDDPWAETPEMHSCGYPDGSFACKIRHVAINTGNLKRDRER